MDLRVDATSMGEVGRVVREEAWRSVGWFVLCGFCWSLVVSATDDIAATTGAVLILATTVVFAALTAGVRLRTGRELRSLDGTPPLLAVLGAGAIAGIACVSLVVALGYPVAVFAAYLAAFAAALAAAIHLVTA